MSSATRRLLTVAAITVCALLTGAAAAYPDTARQLPDTARQLPDTARQLPDTAGPGWSATWTAAPQRPGVSFAPNWSQQGFTRQTVRQIVRISVGGKAARIRLSNRYGTTPLTIDHATLARTALGAAVEPGSLRRLTVRGKRAFTVPAGADLATDPVPLRPAALDSLTITFFANQPTGPATYHAQALATTYRAAGDHAADVGAAAFTDTTQSWYYLTGVDVIPTARHGGVVTFGDSLTDGAGSSADADNRYPDELAELLAATGTPRAVLNQGIAGNRVTVDSAWFGEKATARFRRDVLGQPGVRTVVILAGVNDIGIGELAAAPPSPIFAPYPDVSAGQVIAGLGELIRMAHAEGLRVIGATMMPVKGSAYYTDRSEAKREAVNAWIRASAAFDAVVDLDRVTASPADGDRLDPAYDSGDHLHLNDAGYRAVAGAIDPAELG
ncbi:SGNH/GDSL hydrolase family protein [Nonomuraea rhodomycinica]|uniref:SGNH/GDSL hydrolase family protein n=1 Tax=Nonomuraea rhodomycinica TaxID=1712872 RepID=A0A7Y6MES8_9ACTN|nr:SGNH/GDSL hydrolase family protein [Nonomuraea rhodomycinica]NUW45873.1 SGNH/GDSL hydrolase family protein [Nonomuraea rhodomycinica]